MTAVPVVVTAAAVAAVLVAERSKARWLFAPKAAASSGFVALAVTSGAVDSPYGRWVLAALCLSWIADLALVSERSTWFMRALAALLSSRLAYIVGFAVLGSRAIAALVAIAALAVPAVVVGRWLLPSVPRSMQAPVIAYTAVISLVLAAACGAASDGAPWPILPAAAAFYLSDLGVARDRFVAPGFVNRAIGLPLYYGAQILFAVSTGMV